MIKGIYSPSALQEASRKAEIMRRRGFAEGQVSTVLRKLADTPDRKRNWRQIANEVVINGPNYNNGQTLRLFYANRPLVPMPI